MNNFPFEIKLKEAWYTNYESNMKEEELIKCPYCGHDEYIHEREEPFEATTFTIVGFGRVEHKEIFKFFCSYCNKDF